MLFRGLLIGAEMFLVYPGLPTLAGWFKLTEWQWLLPWYLGMAFIRLVMFSLALALNRCYGRNNLSTAN